MIDLLNRLTAEIDTRLQDEFDPDAWAVSQGTTSYHLRRVFAALAGIPLSEYIRRRKMTIAAGEVMAGWSVLDLAIRYGYSSGESFTRAYRLVHGHTPGETRNGASIASQTRMTFEITVRGREPMRVTITEKPEFNLIGHIIEAELNYDGDNRKVREWLESLPMAEHLRLKSLSSTQPAGLLQVSLLEHRGAEEGSVFRYMHGVAQELVDTAPEDLTTIPVPAGTWAVFAVNGPYPQALQEAYARAAAEWFPSQHWLWREGPTLAAVIERAEDFSTAQMELWIPVEQC